MRTDIEFLRVLEEDLEDAAARETAGELRRSKAARKPRRRLGSSWMRVAAAVIAFVVIAGGVGFVAQRGLRPKGSSAALAPAFRPAPNSAFAGQNAAPNPAVLGPNGRNLQQNVPTFRGAYSPPLSADTGGSGSTGGGGYTGNTAPAATTPTLNDIPQADLSKIVRDGSISIQIPDNTFTARAIAVTKVASDAHGFVLASSTQNQRSGTFTLKIPASHFQAAMAALGALGTIESSQQTGKDVTSQYVDYTARLRILSGRRAVILRLMSKATSISSTLYLQSQFDSVQLQIEQIQGNLNVLRNQVAESTITVDVAEKDSPKPSTTAVTAPSLGKAIRLAWQGLLRVIGAVVVGLGYLIPIALLGLVIWGVTRSVRRRRAAG